MPFHFNYDPSVAQNSGAAIAAVLLAETQGMVNENQRELMEGMIKIGVDQALHNSFLSAESTMSSAIAQGAGEGVQSAGYLGLSYVSGDNAKNMVSLPGKYAEKLSEVDSQIAKIDAQLSTINYGGNFGNAEEEGGDRLILADVNERPQGTFNQAEKERYNQLMDERDQRVREKEMISKDKEFDRALLTENSTSKQAVMNAVSSSGPAIGRVGSGQYDANKARAEAAAQISNAAYGALDSTRQQDEGTVRTMQDSMARIYDGIVASSNKA